MGFLPRYLTQKLYEYIGKIIGAISSSIERRYKKEGFRLTQINNAELVAVIDDL